MRRACRLIAAAVLAWGALLAAPARADQPITALAPLDTVVGGLNELVGVAVGQDGTRYVSDRGAGIVYRITAGGTVSLLVSNLNRPAGLALDAGGRLLIAEEGAGRVLRLEANTTLTILATGIKTPRWLVVNPDGSLYVSAHRLTEPDGADTSEGRDILLLVPGQGLSIVATGLIQVQGLLRLNGSLVVASQGLTGGPNSTGMLLRYPVNPDGTLGAPTVWVGIGIKQPVGLVLDALGAVYVSTKELTTETDTAKRAIGKVHQDLSLTDFAANLTDPQGVALGPDGALYLADGKAGRLLRFRAPPAPALSTPAITNQSPLTLTGTSDPGARVDFFLNGATTAVTVTADAAGAFTASLTLTLNAPNTLEAYATGQGGNGLTSPATDATIVHDNTPPGVSFTQPLANAYVRLTVTVTAQATDANTVQDLTLGTDVGPLSPTLTPPPPASPLTATATWNTLGLADGTHTLSATATDTAGNTNTATRTVIVDNTPPDTLITSGPTGEISVGTATFTFTGTDNLTPVGNLVFAWRLDGGAWSAFTGATTASFTNLAEGSHIFEVKAQDLAGNEDATPAARTFTVRFGPSITNVDPVTGTAGTLVTITGTNFELGATTVTIGGLAAVIRTITATQITTTVPIGAAPGQLTVTTNRGSASTAFTVTTTGDFTLTAAPGSARVIAGDQTSVNIAAGGTGSFTSLVGLTVSTPPAGITAGFSPSNLVAPGSSAFVSFAVPSGVAPGTYGITANGQAQVDGRTLTRIVSFSLEVLAPGTPAVTGRVLTAEAVPQPIPGVTVTLGSAFTLTDAGGNFVLLSPPTGQNMLLVDGRTASTPTAQYPPVEVNIAVNASGTTRVPFVVYLPKLDTANPVSLPLDSGGFTTQEVKATTPAIPGLVVTIPAGTRITDPAGNPVTQITITPVPVDRSPMPFPPGVTPPMLFTIQPGGAVPSQPLPISFPNVTEAAPGTTADLWFFDLAAGSWQTWGTGTVSADGPQVVSDPGFGLPRFAWHFWAVVRDRLQKIWKFLTGGDPVDLFTGRFTVEKTDLVLPGRMPVALQRTYRSDDTRVGLLGLGWNLGVYDSRLTSSGGTLVLTTADQNTFQFRPGAGQWTSTESVFLGAVLTQLPGEFSFQLRYKDGTVHRYDRIAGLANQAGLSAITDRSGNTVTITRSSPAPGLFGLITRIAEPAGRALTLAYDGVGRITSVTDPIGRVVQYGYDGQGHLSTVTDPAGGVTGYTYDASHRILTITDPRNITYLTNEYDAQGRVTRQTQADGGVFSFAYALNGDVVTQTTVTDPRGNATTHRFTAQGFPLSTTDALGQTTSFEYAAGTNLLLSTTDPLGRVTRFTYDALGNVTIVTDPAGTQRTFTYESIFNKVTSITNPLTPATQIAYDSLGNLTTIMDPRGKLTTLTYNGFGQPITTTDPLGNTTTFTYDAQGNLIVTADPLGNTTGFQYDLVSRVIRQTDPRGRPTAFSYDPLNQIRSITDALGGITGFTFDPNGNLLTVTDARGGVITHTYDPMDRLATRTDPVGATESFTYDRVGNLTQRTDRKGQVSALVYDALNQLTTSSYGDGTGTGFTYDATGRLVRIDDSIGGTLTNTYDVLDRLLAQSTTLGTVSYQYDALGRRTQLNVPGVAATTYGYDEASRLTQILQGTQTVGFQYDDAGRRTGLTLPNGVGTEYQYDLASRLVALIYRNAAGELGNVTYGYDAAGNRLRVGGSFGRTLLPNAIATATYDAANRQRIFGAAQMTFDANGNLTTLNQAEGITSFTWDARDRLIAVEQPGTLASFAYAFGRRLSKTINGTTTEYFYDRLDIIQQLEPQGPTTYLRSLTIDELLSFANFNGGFLMLADALGSTVGATDQSGNLATSYTYDPFGATTVTNSTFTNPFQFTGRENDGLSRLYYYRARYYHPGLQRFLGEDPLGLEAGDVNAYTFVFNSPLNLTDPSGTVISSDALPAECAKGSSSGLAGRKPLGIGVRLRGAVGTVTRLLTCNPALDFMPGIGAISGPARVLTSRAMAHLAREVEANPRLWRTIAAHTEPATRKGARQAGVSVQEVLENAGTGERVVRHTVVDDAGRVVDSHLRPNYVPRLGE